MAVSVSIDFKDIDWVITLLMSLNAQVQTVKSLSSLLDVRGNKLQLFLFLLSLNPLSTKGKNAIL